MAYLLDGLLACSIRSPGNKQYYLFIFTIFYQLLATPTDPQLQLGCCLAQLSRLATVCSDHRRITQRTICSVPWLVMPLIMSSAMTHVAMQTIACMQACASFLAYCPCSQVSNGNCDQGFKPTVSTSCSQTPCAVSDFGLALGFTDWGACDVQCGSGYSQRTAYCMNPYGALADLSMCGNYSGEYLHLEQVTSQQKKFKITGRKQTGLLLKGIVVGASGHSQ